MISPFTCPITSPRNLTSKPASSSGLSQVFAAAVVNQQFRDMLLQNPTKALQKGYLGETFSLSKEERELITTIQADSLSDLAQQVNHSLLENC